MYVLESDDLAFGVLCEACEGDGAVSATLDAPDGVRYEVLNCPDCGHVRLVRLP